MKSLKLNYVGVLALTAALSLSLAHAANAQTYNASTDWSPTSSSGIWSYGSETTLGGPLTNYTISGNLGSSIQIWNNPDEISNVPADFKNITDQSVTYGTLTLGAYDTAFHPGQQGQYSVYQFTAPTAGTYNISGSFAPGDSGRTDVFILAGQTQLFSADLVNTPTPSFSGLAALNAGETVDYAVGLSPGTTFSNDTTIVDATITRVAAVPEAATSVSFGLILLMGGAALFIARKRTSNMPA